MNAAGRWRRGSRATLTASFVSCVAVLGACAQDLDASLTTWTFTVESPVDDGGLVPFCPSILRGQNLSALRDEHMPVLQDMPATLAVDDEGVHTLTPSSVDPLGGAILGMQTALTFDFGPIGTAYTSEQPATWTIVADATDTQGFAVSTSVPQVTVTRTLVDGSSAGSTAAVLRYAYDFDCTEIVVSGENNASTTTSCTCDTQTITWRISGS